MDEIFLRFVRATGPKPGQSLKMVEKQKGKITVLNKPKNPEKERRWQPIIF
jgi:hypothetical protein